MPKAPATPAPLYLEGLTTAQLAYWLAVQRSDVPLVVIASDEQQVHAFAQDLRSLGRTDVVCLLADDASPFALAAADAQAGFTRAALRQRLLSGDPPQVIVATAAAVQGAWPPAAAINALRLAVRVGEEIDREALAHHLLICGYQRVNAVEDEGTFAVRGGVIDVFVPEQPEPYRLDLFGDELASIRPFDPEKQKLKEPQPELWLAPIREVLFTSDSVARAKAWLADERERVDVPSRWVRERQEAIDEHQYFFGVESLWPAFYDGVEYVFDGLVRHGATLVFLDAEMAQGIWHKRVQDSEEAREKALQSQGPQVPRTALVRDVEPLLACVQKQPTIWHAPALLNHRQKAHKVVLGHLGELAAEMGKRRASSEAGEILAPLVALFRSRSAQGQHILLMASNHGAAMRLMDLLQARGLDLPLLPRLPPQVTQTQTHATGRSRQACGIVIAPLSASVVDAERGLTLVADTDVFGGATKVKSKRRHKRAPADGLNALHDMRAGDCVIHQDHGIGRYMGLVRLNLDGIDGDFVQLGYADDDKLYVPVFRLSVLKRYHGTQAHAILDKLGGPRWAKAKRRVRDAVLAMAHAMLALEAKRRAHKGFAFAAPDEQYAAFEASFPFEETPDQARAIAETLADLQQQTPMDRLICGDVGFGKTEVSLRAAFMAVQSGKQVAMLVPTTVLAEQHAQTFAARLAPFGITCAGLSRFRTAQQSKEILQQLADKRLDVVVGTHRLLSQDVQVADLGLLIVDEEQRFGVKHKERLKQLRAHVHVLTMSATPIPRTLHMATAGMRQLSLIQTAPTSRTAIRTEVMREDDEVIGEALRREMHRGGQSFVVHNRVQSIHKVAERVRLMVPEAKVLVAHGQMTGEALEKVMVQFVHRQAHVLICTAIIESGIDIPSANTMVVLDAHTFGLSQLYQLRGRIGRGTERAVAYLMLPANLPLNKEVSERLGLLKRFSSLGAGFQVATHDLEMRGAGDLLGSDQSGNINAVGFELYTQLLHEAIEQVRGQGPRTDVEPEIKVPVAAVFPERYMPEPIDRLTFYQRMAEASSDEAIYDIIGQVAQIFGPPPHEAEALAELMVLRRVLRALGASSLSAACDAQALKVGITFVADAPVDRQGVLELCQSEPQTFRVLPSGRLSVRLPLPPIQPADPDRGHDVPWLRGTDLLKGIRRGIAALKAL